MNKIILDCDLMKHPNSGLYHYCLNLGNHVNELLNDNNEAKIKFYVPAEEKTSFNLPQDCIVEKKFHSFFKPFLANCKVWHAPFQSGRMIPYNNRSIKVLLTIHDLNPLHEGKPVEEQKQSLAHTQWLIDRSNAIVCISEFTKNDVLKNCNVGNKPVYVIHNGTHTVHDASLQDSSYYPQRPFLFGMGYVNRKKNFHVLLSLLENTEYDLIIAGHLDEHDYIEEMKQKALEIGVAERLHILGPVSEGEKSWYYQNCLAFVHPSLAEGFGLTVVEAMSKGKPLFLSSLTALPEIGGDIAFYFKNFDTDHMQHVFARGMKEYETNGFSQKIKERSETFNWQISAAKYIEVYESLL
jgi:glycosyltransferase involved in cell wall biosynthesis